MTTIAAHAARARLRRRAGFTLIELLVTMVILGLVTASIITVVARQQRFYRSANEIIDARSQLRQAAGVLPADMRGISTVGGDLLAMEAQRVAMLSTFGSSIVCRRPTVTTGGVVTALLGRVSEHTIEIPPLDGVNNVYTSWLMTPAAGDSLVVLDEGTSRGAEDDRWLRFAIQTVTQSTSACPTGTFATSGESGKPRWSIRVVIPGSVFDAATGTTSSVAGLPATLAVGSVIRFARPVEYALYQSTADARWYLGFREYRASAWSARQPVAGPYRPVGGTGPVGLGFRYFSDQNVELTALADRRRVARIDMVVRTAGSDSTNVVSRGATGVFEDSLAVRVAIRNRDPNTP